MILLFLLVLVVGAYATVLLACAWAWASLPTPRKTASTSQTFFSVIIPVKDEAANLLLLLQDLENQTYPTYKFGVIVVDDHSTDGTPALIQEFQQHTSLQMQLLLLASFPENRLKKGAIEVGVAKAQGDWIACTDGDCRVPAHWLAAMNACRQDQDAKFISGPVKLKHGGSCFQRLQALEFSALIGVGAATIGWRQPTMCNGANLAYEKSAFYAVNGFTGNNHLPSGDDEFLMHKVHCKYPGKVVFLKDSKAVVSTQAVPTFQAFFEQRKRWASKWKHYTRLAPKALAVLVLAANITLWVAFLLAMAESLSWWFVAGALALKLIPDVLLLRQVLGFLQAPKLLLYIGLLQLVYLPYILLTAILGWRGTYAWKDRQHKAS